MVRDQRRVGKAIAVAAVFSGLPSVLHASVTGDGLRSTGPYLLATTRAAGTLLPPGHAGIVRGAIAHAGVSIACGELLAVALPRRHSCLWSAVGGLLIGGINLRVIGRRFPAIHALPLGPQLADHIAFGMLFALTADRGATVPARAPR